MRGNTNCRMVATLSCRAELRLVNLQETAVTGTFLPSCAAAHGDGEKLFVQVWSPVTHRKPYTAL